MDGFTLNKLKESVISYLPGLGGALIITAVGILIAFICVRLARKALLHKKVDPSLTTFLCRALRILIYIFTLLAALSALNISTAGLIAFFSAAAAALALALKDRLNDITSGIIILFTKPFITGDFIEFGKYKGFVQKVELIHTVIKTYDQTNVIIPNSIISNAEVNNYTSDPVIRVQIDVPIPYEADIDKVKEVLYGVIDSTPKTVSDDDHTPTVRLESFAESSLDFNVRVFCDYADYWTVYYHLTENIKHALDKNNISIPFNQMDVHIVSDDSK